MASKFNVDYLKGSSSAQSDANDETLSKFKSTKEIFDKADNMIDNISIDKLIPFERHPFIVREGERLDELTQSIREQGILVPLIVRCHSETKGSYEVLAGHHRLVGAQRAGLDSLPCIIKNVDDYTAVLIVVESNKQRGFADMLPSEIARALKMEYDALKHQGKRTDLVVELEGVLSDEKFMQKSAANPDDSEVNTTLVAMQPKLDSQSEAGKRNNMSRSVVRYYIRLNNLISPLLNLVDTEIIAIRSAVDLSFLMETEQQFLYDILETSNYKVDMKKSAKLKEYSQAEKLNEDSARLILSGEIFNVKEKKVTSVKLPIKKIQSYIPQSIAIKDYEGYIVDALEFYRNNFKEDD